MEWDGLNDRPGQANRGDVRGASISLLRQRARGKVRDKVIKVKRLLWLIWIALLFAVVPFAWSQPGQEQQQRQEKPIMMGRISQVEGQLLRYIPAEKDWVAIAKDAPFGENDALYSDEKSRAEFIMPNNMPNNTWVRTDGSSQIQTIKLAEDTTEMDVASGEARVTNKSSKAPRP